MTKAKASRTKQEFFWLGVSNIIVALLGIAKTLVTARWLGVVNYGIIGLLLSFGTLVQFLLDIRLADLTTKLYADSLHNGEEENNRLAILQVSLLLHFVLCIAGILLAVILTNASGHFVFKNYAPHQSAIFLAALAMVGNFITNQILFCLQLFGESIRLNTVKLAGHIISSFAFFIVLYMFPSIEGFFWASGLNAVLIAILFLAAISFSVSHHFSAPLWHLTGQGKKQFMRFVEERHYLFAGNVQSLGRVMHRGLDVLAVGFLGTPAEAGIYRLGRQLADMMYMFYDALNQFMLPGLFKLMAKGDWKQFWLTSRIAMGLSAALFLLAVPGCIFVLPFLFNPILGPGYESLPSVMAVLSVSFPGLFGVHIWVWPFAVHKNKAHFFGFAVLLSAIAQYVVLNILSHYMNALYAGGFSFALYYIVLYGVLASWALLSRVKSSL